MVIYSMAFNNVPAVPLGIHELEFFPADSHFDRHRLASFSSLCIAPSGIISRVRAIKRAPHVDRFLPEKLE